MEPIKSILKTEPSGNPNNVRFSNRIRSSSDSKNIDFNESTTWRESHSSGENNPYIGFSTPETSDFQDSDSIKDRSDSTFSRSLAINDDNNRSSIFNAKVSNLDLLERNTVKYPNIPKDEIIEMTQRQVGLSPQLLPPRKEYDEYPLASTPYTTSKKNQTGTPIKSMFGNKQWDETIKKVKFLEENKNNPYDSQESTSFFGFGGRRKNKKSKKINKKNKNNSKKTRRSSKKYKRTNKNKKLRCN